MERTKRKLVKTALMESETRFRATFEQASTQASCLTTGGDRLGCRNNGGFRPSPSRIKHSLAAAASRGVFGAVARWLSYTSYRVRQ